MARGGVGGAGLGVLVQAVLDLAVEATQVRRQEVADHVAGAHVVGVADAAASAHRVDHAGARAVGAEGIEHGVVPEGGGVVAPQPHFTEAAGEADGGAAIEIGDAVGTVVVADRCFEPEAGRQSAAQVFGAAEADAAGVVPGVGKAPLALLAAGTGDGVARGGRLVAHAGIDDAEQGNGRLGRGQAGNGQRGECREGFLHSGFSGLSCSSSSCWNGWSLSKFGGIWWVAFHCCFWVHCVLLLRFSGVTAMGVVPWGGRRHRPLHGFPALLTTGGVSQNSLRSNSCEP
jgi:hypothetical protein